MINNFVVWKNTDKESEKQPDYKAVAKVGEDWVEIGAGWIKEKDGKKYISFQLKKPYNQASGFEITEVKPPENQKPEYPEPSNFDQIPF